MADEESADRPVGDRSDPPDPDVASTVAAGGGDWDGRRSGEPSRASVTERAFRRARLAAIAAPRETDTPELAALRAVLRDEVLMARVIANVERWPPLTDEQLEVLAALFNRARRRGHRTQ